MELTIKAQFLNPDQIVGLGRDQSLHAIAKQLQWKFPHSIGEEKLLMMMGALHIEDKAHELIGKILRDSGWTIVLSQAQVLRVGCAQSMLNEHHIKRTRYAHQMSLTSLYSLKQKAHLSTVSMFLDHRSHCRCGMNVVRHRDPCSSICH